jgi:hypothetical protein
MLEYVKEEKMDKKIDDIQNIIEPQKFLDKHFDAKGDPNILFEQVLKEASPRRTEAEYDAIMTKKQRDLWDDTPAQADES